MDFLAPLFAIAGLAVGIVPIVLHMLRRAPTEQMPFSVVRFLKPSHPRLTRRSRIEHWPLMLLRIAALLLIAAAFARPFLRTVVPLEQDKETAQAVTLLLDRSASMRRDGIYDKVMKLVPQITGELNQTDLLSVATFSDTTTTLITHEQWAAASTDERASLIEGVLQQYEPDWMGTQLGSALRLAADQLTQESRRTRNIRQRRLVVITDFQRGSQLQELQTGDWPAQVSVDLHIVEPAERGNAGITYVPDRRVDRTRVRISNAGDSPQSEFFLQPFDADGAPVGEPISVSVAPGQRRSLLLPAADPEAGKIVAGVELKGDKHPFDNVIDLPEVQSPVVRVAHIGPSQPNDPETMRYYLQRVFDGNVERDVQLTDLLKDNGVVLPVPQDVRLVVATDQVPPALLDSLETFLNRSGTLLMAAPSAAAVESIRRFLPVNTQITEADVTDYAMLADINFRHPVFSAFADAKFADFSSIRFWHHRNVSLPEEDRQPGNWSVVARYDSGLPAILDIRHADAGRILLLTSGWHPHDSQLALSTRFPALLTRILSLASPARTNLLVQNTGDTIRPDQIVQTNEWSVRTPDGTEIRSIQLSTSDKNKTVQLTTPGRYLIRSTTESSAPQVVSLIAQLPSTESKTERLPVGQLQVLGINAETEIAEEAAGSQHSAEEKNGQLNATQLEQQQQWWRWLLLTGILLLLIEAVWASRIERQHRLSPADGLS